MNRLSSPWRSTSTRILASYGLLFVLWAFVLILLIYVEVAARLSADAEQQLKERAEYLAALEPGDLRAHLRAMYEFDLMHINSYGLFDPTGIPLAGHIATLPDGLAFDGRSHLYKQPGADGTATSTRILAIRLRNGEQLLLARDAGLIDRIHDLILRAVLWGLSLTIVPGIIGGILLNVRPLRRIRAIQQASEAVSAGQLSTRLPVSGRDDELDRLAGIVNQMLEEIERLIHEIKSVCDNVAHDLRTPLTHLRARLYRIQQLTPETDPRFSIVEGAVNETDELLARFAALLRVSELRDEHRRAAFEDVDLVAVLGEVRDLYEPLAEEKSIALTLEGGPLEPVRGDRQLLIEAFSNLVSNAIKFTPAGGRVTLRASADPEGPRVDVVDSGPGIPPEQRRAVFDRFHRLDRSRSTPGFGLGLSIVAAIVDLHGFSVEIADAPSGSCFTVRCWRKAS